MKMNIIKHIATAAIPAALLLTGPTAPAQNYPEGSYRVVGGIGFNKHVTDNHDGSFTVDLESFVTGKIKTETTTVPADVIVVMDISASMDNTGASSAGGYDRTFSTNPVNAVNAISKNVTSNSKGQARSATWTYDLLDDAAYSFPFYLHEDGKYYKVHRGRFNSSGEEVSNGNRYLCYIIVDGEKWYFSRVSATNRLTKEQPTGSMVGGTVFYSGNLYDRGWTYSGVSRDESIYSYLFDGNYYPVKREIENGVYALYVMLPEGKRYLNGGDLTIQPEDFVTAATHNIYIGTLYSGGWTYNDIGGDNVYYYKDTDNKYYLVYRGNNLADVNGGNSARALWIEKTPGNKQYLKGTGLAEDYVNSVLADDQTIFAGTLYKGMSYNDFILPYASPTSATEAQTGHFYKGEDNKYYPIKKEIVNGLYQVYVDLPDGKMYLNMTTISTSIYPLSTTSASSIYFGNSVYTVASATRYTRIEGLRRAILTFVDALAEKSKQQGLNHRLALVEFSNPAGTSGLNTPKLEEFLTLKTNGTSGVVVDFREMLTGDGGEINVTNVTTLKNSFPASIPSTSGGSYYARGFSYARGLIRRERGVDEGTDINADGTIASYEIPKRTEDQETYDKRPKIVITIGDFQAAENGNATDEANKLKAINATTMVSVQVGANPSSASVGYAKNYASPNQYYLATNFDETLIETLMDITEDIGGAELEVEGTVVTVDVVSKAFDIPKGEDVSKPTVLVANLTGKREGTSWDPAPLTTGAEGDFVFYTFGTPVEQDVTVDPRTGETPSGIKLVETTDAEGNEKLEVTGFDYSAHWCGPDNKTSTGYHTDGQKLILRFTVVPNEKAVGGPAVQTNTEESGIYADGERIATFNQPSVSLPVNLWIEKQGLEGDDSAVFTIYYADPSAPANAGKSPHEMTYQSFTKVIVHAKDMVDGKALVKITGLDSKFYYKIKEDAWAWSYDDQTGEMYSSDVIQNPIKFVNEKKTETVKHAESVVTNVFSTNE